MKVYFCSAHYFLEELVPFALQMICTSQSCDGDKQEQSGKNGSEL